MPFRLLSQFSLDAPVTRRDNGPAYQWSPNMRNLLAAARPFAPFVLRVLRATSRLRAPNAFAPNAPTLRALRVLQAVA